MNRRFILLSTALIALTAVAGSFFFANGRNLNTIESVGIDGLRQAIIADSNEVRGTVKSINADSGSVRTVLELEVEIPDLSTLTPSGPISFFKKMITVSVPATVTIDGTAKPEAGDLAMVILDRSVYEAESFSAVKISIHNYQEEMREQASALPLIRGTIGAVRGDTFTVTARVPNLEKMDDVDFSGSFVVPQTNKRFSVELASTTKFLKGTQGDLRPGRMVRVWGDNLPVANSFTASRIFLE